MTKIDSQRRHWRKAQEWDRRLGEIYSRPSTGIYDLAIALVGYPVLEYHKRMAGDAPEKFGWVLQVD